MIELYEVSELNRIERERREEAARKAEEECKLEEELREHYNDEIDLVAALVNCANDYDISCKIRNYISAVEQKVSINEKDLAWIEWAKKKADWFDPAIAYEDQVLGKREHNRDENYKELKRHYHYW
ncbi:MAG: hypothetical protein RR581_06400 [Eubacterium sp.]